MKRAIFAIIAGLICLLAASAIHAAQTAPRFIFKQDDILTYRVVSQMKGGNGFQQQIKGTVEFKVLSMRKDGTAKVRMSTTAEGSLSMGGETIPLESEEPCRVMFMVKPNGAITSLMDVYGKETNLMSTLRLFDPSSSIQLLLIGKYALFGLQLPDKLPERGEEWIAQLQEEDMSSVNFDSNFDFSNIKLKPVPVTFTYLGKGKLKGSDEQETICLAFRYETSFRVRRDDIAVPVTVYLDPDSGRILGFKAEKESPDFTHKTTIVLAES